MRLAAAAGENIDFKAECKKHNFGKCLARNRSNSLWRWNPELDRKGK